MLKTAITGNIGSGKTTVCRIFEILGVPVFYADTEARKLYHDEEVINAVESAFGREIFDDNRHLLRQKLADIVFHNPAALKTLNGIIHPRLILRYTNWLQQRKIYPYTLHEAAIIFENGLEKYFDRIINVSCPENIRLERIKKRDNLSDNEIKSRMQWQWPDEKKNELSDFVIVNDGSRFLIPQIIKIHKELKNEILLS